MGIGAVSRREEQSEERGAGEAGAASAKPRAGIGTPPGAPPYPTGEQPLAQGGGKAAAAAGGVHSSEEAGSQKEPGLPGWAASSKEPWRGQAGVSENCEKTGGGEELSMEVGGGSLLDMDFPSDPSPDAPGTPPLFGSASSGDSFLAPRERETGEGTGREAQSKGSARGGSCQGDDTLSLPDDCLLTILERLPGTRERNSFALASRHCWELEAGSRTRLRLGPGLHPATQALSRLSNRFPSLKSIHFDYLGWKSSAGPQVGDDALRLLVLRCTALTDLSLSFCGFVTDTGLAYLGHCPTLRSLRLNFTPCVTGRGLLSVVLGCPRLEDLHVERCMGLRSSEWLEALGSAQTLTDTPSSSNNNSSEPASYAGAGGLSRGAGGAGVGLLGGPPIAASAPNSPLPTFSLSPLPAAMLTEPMPAVAIPLPGALAQQQGTPLSAGQGGGLGTPQRVEGAGVVLGTPPGATGESAGPWLPPAHPRLTRSASGDLGGGAGGPRRSFDLSSLPSNAPPLLHPSSGGGVVEGPVSVYMTPTHVVASPMDATHPSRLSATSSAAMSSGATSGCTRSSLASSLGSPLPGLPHLSSPQTPPTLHLSSAAHPGGMGGPHGHLSPLPLLLTPPAPTAPPLGSPMVYPASAAWDRASAGGGGGLRRAAVGVKRLTIANCRGIGEGDLARLGRAGWERLESLRFEMDLHPRDQLLPSTAAFAAFAPHLDLRRLRALSLSHCPRVRSEGLALVLNRLGALHSQTTPHPSLSPAPPQGNNSFSGMYSRTGGTDLGAGGAERGTKGAVGPGEGCAWGLTELRLVSCPGLNDADVRHLLSCFASSLRVLSLSLVKWLGGTAAHAPAAPHPAPVRASAGTAAVPQGAAAAGAMGTAGAGLETGEAPTVPFPAPFTPGGQGQHAQALAPGQTQGQAQGQGRGPGAPAAHQESTWAVTTASLWYVGAHCRGLEELELICRDDFPSSAPLFRGFADAAVADMVANLPALRRLKVGKGLHLSQGLLAQLRKDHPGMTLQLV